MNPRQPLLLVNWAGHKASIGYFGDATPVPMKTFRNIFNAVRSGACQYGVVPWKSSVYS
jgi:prephenate dehydratase